MTCMEFVVLWVNLQQKLTKATLWRSHWERLGRMSHLGGAGSQDGPVLVRLIESWHLHAQGWLWEEHSKKEPWHLPALLSMERVVLPPILSAFHIKLVNYCFLLFPWHFLSYWPRTGAWSEWICAQTGLHTHNIILMVLPRCVICIIFFYFKVFDILAICIYHLNGGGIGFWRWSCKYVDFSFSFLFFKWEFWYSAKKVPCPKSNSL